MSGDRPIGVFDSGVGGLTDASDRFLRIARAILGADPEHLEVVNLEGAS